MGLSARDYRRQLQGLLPEGKAWPRDEDGTLTAFLDAAAEEFARVDGRTGALVDEADPTTTAELLADWERVAGLPDNCSGQLADTLQQRREDLRSKLTSTGGQSREYIIAIGQALGFDVSIEEIRPFRVGKSRTGDRLTNGDWRFTWRLRAPEVTVKRFRVGQSAVGEKLATWGNAGLECRINQIRPAHTNLIFAYGTVLPTLLLLPDGGALVAADGAGLLVETADG